MVKKPFEWQKSSDYRLSIAIAYNQEPIITAMQKGYETTISQEDMDKILEIIEKDYKDIFANLSKELDKASS